MRYCPECGGQLIWNTKLKQYVCESCGAMFTRKELEEYRRKLFEEQEEEDYKREYEKWWISDQKS